MPYLSTCKHPKTPLGSSSCVAILGLQRDRTVFRLVFNILIFSYLCDDVMLSSYFVC